MPSGIWLTPEEYPPGRVDQYVVSVVQKSEAADEILVFDRGRLVQRGPHSELVAVPGVYADLHASWTAQRTV